MDVSFTLGEIEERDFEVAAQPGLDNISVCTCTGFCLRETGRNACLCRSAQRFCTSSCHRARGTASLWINTRSVAGRFFRKWRGIKVYLFFPCGKIFVQLQTCQGAFRVRPTPKIRQEFRSRTPSGRQGADASNLVPSPQARLSPLPTANAKERRSNEDKKVDGLKTYGSVYLFMSIITTTTF